MPPSRQIPTNLRDHLPPIAALEIERLFGYMYDLRDQLDSVKQPVSSPVLASRSSDIPAAAFGGGGNDVLGPVAPNVTPFLNPQIAKAPSVTALPNVQSDPLSQDGTLVSFLGVIYRFDGLSTIPGTWVALSGVGISLVGTHATRLATAPAGYADGVSFYETDRQVWYVKLTVLGVAVWSYTVGIFRETFANRPTIADVGGANSVGYWFYATNFTHSWRSDGTNWILQPQLSTPYRRTQAQIAAVTAGLTANDVGFLIDVTDYKHRLYWGGAALDFDNNDPGSAFVLEGQPDGSAPNGGFWGACDGTAYDVLLGDGSLDNITTEDRTNFSFAQGVAAADVGPRAADAPTFGAGAKTEDTVVAQHGSTQTGANGAAEWVFTDTNASKHTTHHHDLTDGNAPINAPSEADGGLPARVGVVYFIRR